MCNEWADFNEKLFSCMMIWQLMCLWLLILERMTDTIQPPLPPLPHHYQRRARVIIVNRISKHNDTLCRLRQTAAPVSAENSQDRWCNCWNIPTNPIFAACIAYRATNSRNRTQLTMCLLQQPFLQFRCIAWWNICHFICWQKFLGRNVVACPLK